MRILLVEPDYPIPAKSKNHKNFLPIGLLKIASYLRNKGDGVKLVRGVPDAPLSEGQILNFRPNKIWITSLFTYWSQYVRDSVQYYKKLIPTAKITVGGIYASLMPDHCKKYTGCDEVHIGVLEEAENAFPAYDLLENSNPTPLDYQILHASRGCARQCEFCGTWKIEPEFLPKATIKQEVRYKKLVFYDNNLLANPHIATILEELADLKKKRQILWCESQSGFDGRILLRKPTLGIKLRQAGFRYPRIAWDWKYADYPRIKRQIDVLSKAGYNPKDISVFVLYNWDIPFDEMERKRLKCWEWQVQIADCRFRPLDQTFDNYDPRVVDQTDEDYHIHVQAGWTDQLVKQFRKNVRRQNICVRHGFELYSSALERKRVQIAVFKALNRIKTQKQQERYLKSKGVSYWVPSRRNAKV